MVGLGGDLTGIHHLGSFDIGCIIGGGIDAYGGIAGDVQKLIIGHAIVINVALAFPGMPYQLGIRIIYSFFCWLYGFFLFTTNKTKDQCDKKYRFHVIRIYVNCLLILLKSIFLTRLLCLCLNR